MDFHNVEFAKFLARLDPHPPITEALKAALANRSGRPSRNDTERAHMSSWFTSQTTTGQGAYSRRRPNYSARVTYNRLLSTPGLIWISEALDIDPERSQEAADLALGPGRVNERCRAIRKIFPWPEIAEHTTLLADTRRKK